MVLQLFVDLFENLGTVKCHVEVNYFENGINTKLITKKQKRERCKKLQTFFTILFQNNGNFAQERAVFLEAFGSQ